MRHLKVESEGSHCVLPWRNRHQRGLQYGNREEWVKLWDQRLPDGKDNSRLHALWERHWHLYSLNFTFLPLTRNYCTSLTPETRLPLLTRSKLWCCLVNIPAPYKKWWILNSPSRGLFWLWNGSPGYHCDGYSNESWEHGRLPARMSGIETSH